MKKHKIIKVCLLLILALLALSALSAYTIIYYIRGGMLSEEFAHNIKMELIENVTNIQVIEYDWLDDKYKKYISKSEFENSKTIEEYLTLFEKINTIECKPNSFQNISVYSTDFGKKEASQIITDSSGSSYFIYHHIDVASSLFFKPVIVNWDIEIVKINDK